MTRITDHQPERPAQDEPAIKALARLHGAFAIVVTWPNGEPLASIVSVDDGRLYRDAHRSRYPRRSGLTPPDRP